MTENQSNIQCLRIEGICSQSYNSQEHESGYLLLLRLANTIQTEEDHKVESFESYIAWEEMQSREMDEQWDIDVVWLHLWIKLISFTYMETVSSWIHIHADTESHVVALYNTTYHPISYHQQNHPSHTIDQLGQRSLHSSTRETYKIERNKHTPKATYQTREEEEHPQCEDWIQ